MSIYCRYMSDPVLPAEGLFHRRSVDEQRE